MEFSFALLMIVSCILGVWAFIMTERNISNERKLKEMQEKQAAAIPDAESYSAVLTPELISEAVRANGYVPNTTEHSVDFKIQGETYVVLTGRLPVLTLYKGYALDKADYDMDLLRQACHRLSDEMIMVKAFVSDDEDGINFQVTTLEHCFGNFCASLGRSIDIINEAVDRNRAIYHEMEEARDRRASAGSLPERASASSASFS